jgi:hypothetical protein
MTGQGRAQWPTGEIYEGAFLDGRRHGQGRLVYADGTVNEGTWKDDLFVPTGP